MKKIFAFIGHPPYLQDIREMVETARSFPDLKVWCQGYSLDFQAFVFAKTAKEASEIYNEYFDEDTTEADFQDDNN